MCALLLLGLAGCQSAPRPLPGPVAASAPELPPVACPTPAPLPDVPIVYDPSAPQGYMPVPQSRALKLVRALDPASQGLSSWREYAPALRASLDYVMARPQDQQAIVDLPLVVTWGQLRRSIERLINILPALDRRPELLARHFAWYEYRSGMLMTGYCTPEIDASLERRPGYDYPIYGVPGDLRRDGRGRSCRVENGRRLPYHDRRAVDLENVLAGRGLEIAWARDPLDVFYLQIEGCGQLRLPDGSLRTVVYGADNGHRFRSLSRILAENGILPHTDVSRRRIREYFAQHPGQMRELMAENRRYIFFRFSEHESLGAVGRPLTPKVSLATDPHRLPLGSPFIVMADVERGLPREQGADVFRLRGLGAAHDVGTAIRGARLDFYTGEGFEAEDLAWHIRNPAAVYLLLSKDCLDQ